MKSIGKRIGFGFLLILSVGLAGFSWIEWTRFNQPQQKQAQETAKFTLSEPEPLFEPSEDLPTSAQNATNIHPEHGSIGKTKIGEYRDLIADSLIAKQTKQARLQAEKLNREKALALQAKEKTIRDREIALKWEERRIKREQELSQQQQLEKQAQLNAEKQRVEKERLRLREIAEKEEKIKLLEEEEERKQAEQVRLAILAEERRQVEQRAIRLAAEQERAD